MERDKGLIKAILQDIRDNKKHDDLWINMLIKDKGYDRDKVEYHIRMLFDDKLIDGTSTINNHWYGRRRIVPHNLTILGHDYLEKIEMSWFKKIIKNILEVSGKITWIAIGSIITWFITFTLSKLYGV